MFPYNDENFATLPKEQRAYTVSPGTAYKIENPPKYPDNAYEQHEKALQRLGGNSSLPLGYYTTRRILPPTDTVMRVNSIYESSPPTPSQYSMPAPQPKGQYTSPSTLESKSKAPVKKRIEKKMRKDTGSGGSIGSNSSLENYQPKSLPKLSTPVIDEGLDNPFVDGPYKIADKTPDDGSSDSEESQRNGKDFSNQTDYNNSSETLPLYSKVNKNKIPSEPSSPGKSGNDEPLYFTINDAKKEETKEEKQEPSSIQTREPTSRPMSVFDELKQRFSLLKSNPEKISHDVQTQNMSSQSMSNATTSSPQTTSTPAPLIAASPIPIPVDSPVAPQFIQNPPPPPNFIPPPPPSDSVSQPPDFTPSTPPASAISSSKDSNVTQPVTEDRIPAEGKEKSDSNGSSETDSTDVSESEDQHEEVDGIKSILKNRHEKSLIDVERLSRSDDLDGDEEEEVLDPNSKSGVSFSKDTHDNEGTGKQYEKEGISNNKITSPLGTVLNNYVLADTINPLNNIENDSSEVLYKEDKDKDINQNIYDKPRSPHKPVKTETKSSSPPKSILKPAEVKQDKTATEPRSILKSTESQGGTMTQVFNNPRRGSHTSEMYYTLSKTPDNISVINISMDTGGSPVPITSEKFFTPQSADTFGYNTDTINSNYSTGTMRTVITLGSTDDLDTSITPIIFTPSTPNNNTVAFSYPVKEESKAQTKKKSGNKHKKKKRSKKSLDKKPTKDINSKSNNLTLAENGLDFEKHVIQVKAKKRRQKRWRIGIFVTVVAIVIVATILVIYFVLN